MRILVDAMGGDLAPDEIVKGAVHAQQELGAEIVLVGQRAAIEACLRNEQAKLEIIDANEVITMERFDLTELIRGVINSSAILLNQNEITLDFTQQEPLYAWADEFKVEEVVTNLSLIHI